MFCAIDFGTSNSAIAVLDGDTKSLVELEPGQLTTSQETNPIAVDFMLPQLWG